MSDQKSPGGPANFDTLAIRTQAERSLHREHSVPMFLTSSFAFDSAEHARALFAEEEEGLVYSRYGNPNVDEFIEKLCLLEGCEDGVATASGMAAMFASMAALLSAGDHVVASRAIFGSTHAVLTKVLNRFGVEHTYVDPTDLPGWERAITPRTRMIFVETPSNPGLALVDLQWLGALAKDRGVILNVDNCFATPYLQNPARLGADLVTHSATKFIDGQGRVLGGAVLGPAKLISEVRSFCRATGPALSAFNAWLLSKSLETLSVRMERHCENALAVARHLQSHPKINEVRYPFLDSHPQVELARRQMRHGGGVVTFEVAGGIDGGTRFLDGLSMITRSSNLGDARSIATHPATTTHSKLTEAERQAVGITPGLVRVSIGLETVTDIIADITQALDSVD